eukprot:CAMPEP_0117562344 /NCGR_PEP_ID=MMETSP0784-20121206/54909_1 /TAXON_ID=39447 /ORGANISM="" /LENGTH=166 /DNA_ID=CAMNT_0005359913 /DNA_START=81 /DNA_END=577 /DNA_ORIENTATION=+
MVAARSVATALASGVFAIVAVTTGIVTAFVAPSLQLRKEPTLLHAAEDELRVHAAVPEVTTPRGMGYSASEPWILSAGVGILLFGAAGVASRRRTSGGLVVGELPTRRQVVSRQAFENELGVQPPVGFWDPAGFTSDGDAKEFFRRRCVEIKHGRVSMLACIGYIV